MKCKLLPIVSDPLIDAIANGYEYDAYHTHRDDPVDDAMTAFDFDEAMNYIDLMPTLSVELVMRRLQRDGDGGFDPHGEQIIAWCGRTFAKLVEYEANQLVTD